MPPPSIDLPVIDVSDRNLALGKTRKAATDKLIECFSSVGFCLITGVEQEGYDADELLKWTKWFHDELPEDVKLEQLATKAFNSKNKNLYRGYFPLQEGSLSYKKGYDFGPDLPDEGVQEGNPFRQKTPRLNIPGKEGTLKEFYQV